MRRWADVGSSPGKEVRGLTRQTLTLTTKVPGLEPKVEGMTAFPFSLTMRTSGKTSKLKGPEGLLGLD